MQIDIITGAVFLFLTLGVIYTGLIVYWFVEDLIHNYRGKSKTNKTEYTEEEEFYATLLQMKSDLDAEAFEASRDMLNEVFRHKRD